MSIKIWASSTFALSLVLSPQIGFSDTNHVRSINHTVGTPSPFLFKQQDLEKRCKLDSNGQLLNCNEPPQIVPVDNTYIGELPNDKFGKSIAAIGDVNGDGKSDLAVLSNEAIYVISPGTGSTLSSATIWKRTNSSITCTLESILSAERIKAAGDVNADGIEDVIFVNERGANDHGEVCIISGANGNMIRYISGGSSYPNPHQTNQTLIIDKIGYDFDTAGDVNGDGHADLMVSAKYNVTENRGRVYLFSGKTGALLNYFEGEPDDYLGVKVANVGDLDGNGLSDIVMVNQTTDFLPKPNSVYLFSAGISNLLSGDLANASLEIEGPAYGSTTNDDYFGQPTRQAPDLDHDGLPDLALYNRTYAGARLIEFYSGITGAHLAQLSAPEGSTIYFATDLLTAGDANGDGIADLLVSDHRFDNSIDSTNDHGAIYLFSGKNLKCLSRIAGQAAEMQFGQVISQAGDTNQDSYNEIAVTMTLDNYIGTQDYQAVRVFNPELNDCM